MVKVWRYGVTTGAVQIMPITVKYLLVKKKSSKKSKKIIFVQDTGVFMDEFFVAIGLSYDEIVRGAKKLGAVKIFFEHMGCAKEEHWEEHREQDAGFVLIDKDNHPFLLWMKNYEDSWGFWEKMLHEVVHIVQALERSKMLQKEDECRAYTTEYIFRKIRRKLSGLDTGEEVKF